MTFHIRLRNNPVPEEFASEEEAAEFWDRHDTTGYLDAFETVAVDAQLERRRFLIELDSSLLQRLAEQAHDRGIGLHALITELLQGKTRSAA